jgi:putative membrane protein
MSKAPRAIRLDGQQPGEPVGEVPIRQGDLAILPESEPFDPVEPAAVPVKPRRGFSWGSPVRSRGSPAFLTLSIGVWVENGPSPSLMNESPVLGYAALACGRDSNCWRWS